MAEEPQNISRYTSLDDIVKLYLIQVGAVNNARYNQYMTLAQLAYQELEMDVLKKFTYRYLPVDSATKTVAIPDDMLQYTMIGFVNQVGEVIELSYDPKLVFRQEVLSPVCHCDECGCTDEVCSTISNVVLSETVVTIPTPLVQCDYSVTLLFGQLEGLCANPTFPFTFTSVTIDGFTTTIGTVVNDLTEYEAVIDALNISNIPSNVAVIGTNSGGGGFVCSQTISYYTDYPMTVINYVKNGVTVTDGTVVANLAELDAYMLALGWTRNTLSPSAQTYVISNSNDTWGAFNIESQTTAHQQAVTLNSSCSTVTVDETYTNYCRTCTNASGDIVRECCTYGGQFINECDYSIELPPSVRGGGGFSFPLTDAVITIDGTDTTIASMDGITYLIDYLIGIGFYVTDIEPLILRKNLSANVYGSISSVIQDLSFDFTSSNCLSMEIAQTCNTETICNVPIKECGCVVMNDKEINTLYNANIINNAMYNRWINGGDISTTYLQPYNLYGFYNVDVHKGIIQLDPFFPYDTIYLEYYGSSEVSTKNFAVPLLAREFILSYIHKMANLRKGNVPRGELEYFKKECRAAKHNLRLRWQPPREKQIIDLLKTPPAKG